MIHEREKSEAWKNFMSRREDAYDNSFVPKDKILPGSRGHPVYVDIRQAEKITRETLKNKWHASRLRFTSNNSIMRLKVSGRER